MLGTAFESVDSSEESLKEYVRRLAVDSQEIRLVRGIAFILNGFLVLSWVVFFVCVCACVIVVCWFCFSQREMRWECLWLQTCPCPKPMEYKIIYMLNESGCIYFVLGM